MLIVGLTGGIATGKSTVSNILRAAGFAVVDADVVARQVVEPGTKTLEKIKLDFGPDMIENGTLNRRKLGQIVFSNPAELKRLNTIMQPAIASTMMDKIAFWRTQKVPILIVDMPLLFERDYDKKNILNKIIVVHTTEAIQKSRLEARDGLDSIQAQNRMQSQMPMADKIAGADYILDNTGDKTALTVQVNELIIELREIASKYDTK